MTQNTVEIVQADRDAAADYMCKAGTGTTESYRRYVQGSYDASNIVQAFARHRLSHSSTPSDVGGAAVRFDVEFIDTIAKYAQMTGGREQGPPCENCRKPVEVGQVVLPWDGAGEKHADCERPFSLEFERADGEPYPVVLLGAPMKHVPLSAIVATLSEQGKA